MFSSEDAERRPGIQQSQILMDINWGTNVRNDWLLRDFCPDPMRFIKDTISCAETSPSDLNCYYAVVFAVSLTCCL